MRVSLPGVALLLVIALCVPALPAAAAGGDPRPNIVFILTDNQPASILGTYGNPDVATPNLDRLAAEGIRFDRAYAVNGMCSPTRATLMTGLMPSQHGVHSWLDDEQLSQWPAGWSAVAEFRSLPLTLRNRGYDTAMVGKWHLGQPDAPSLGYRHWVTFGDGHTVDFWDNEIIENGKRYRLSDQHLVEFFTDKAIEYLRMRDGKQPFYLQLNLDGPYLNPPTNAGPARNRFYKQYVGREFPSFPRVAVHRNLIDQLLDPGTTPFLRGKIIETLEMHNDPATMANVASQNTLVDYSLGRVLDALRELDLEDDTLVVYSSDQGNFFGQHGLWQHTIITSPASPHETPLRIPLVLRHPGRIPAGQVSDALIGQYDIPVTLLDYLGIGDARFDASPGQSFQKELGGPGTADAVAANREAVFFEQEETRGIRTRDYAYWTRIGDTGPDVLYDMRTDPGQTRNVADDPDYGDVVADLGRRLDEFFERYSDRTYDLWRGGTAKGSVDRPQVFRRLYGDDWRTEAVVKPAFEEAPPL